MAHVLPRRLSSRLLSARSALSSRWWQPPAELLCVYSVVSQVYNSATMMFMTADAVCVRG